jgi:hypothetical protein
VYGRSWSMEYWGGSGTGAEEGGCRSGKSGRMVVVVGGGGGAHMHTGYTSRLRKVDCQHPPRRVGETHFGGNNDTGSHTALHQPARLVQPHKGWWTACKTDCLLAPSSPLSPLPPFFVQFCEMVDQQGCERSTSLTPPRTNPLTPLACKAARAARVQKNSRSECLSL